MTAKAAACVLFVEVAGVTVASKNHVAGVTC